jgi:hypothetical protein
MMEMLLISLVMHARTFFWKELEILSCAYLHIMAFNKIHGILVGAD